MTAPTTHELLRNEIETLPEPIAAEVLDFVLFVKARHDEEAYLWRQVEVAYERRRQHPDDVLTVTAEEWNTLTAELEDDADGLSAAL